MATNKIVAILVSLAIIHCSTQDTNDNLVEDENPFQEAAKAILKEQNLQNIGGMLMNSFIENGGNKILENVMKNVLYPEPTKDVNTGEKISELLGHLASQEGTAKLAEKLANFKNVIGSEGNDRTIDPQLIGSVLNKLRQNFKENKPTNGIDYASLIPTLSSFFANSGENPPNILAYLPTVMDTINNFLGPDAESREKAHEDHAWLLPPVVEKFHVLYDHFKNSGLGKQMMDAVGGEKFIKIFADAKGNIDYQKVVDMLENHSFRRHWIKMVTDRIAAFIHHYANPKMHNVVLYNIQILGNSWFTTRGYPKKALLDFTNRKRSIDSLTAFFEHTADIFFNEKVDARQYVTPAVKYLTDIVKLSTSLNTKSDQSVMSNKLADTINLEIIEPIARVNRAYRFVTKHPECDKYVFCLINDEVSNQKSASLPGLRQSLSKATSIVLSWFVSGKTGTPFLTLYSVVQGNEKCQTFYTSTCAGFHGEEHKVTTEYVHNEL